MRRGRNLAEISARLKEAEEKLEAEFRARKFEAEKKFRLGDKTGAAREFSHVMLMIPDARDERHIYARNRLKAVGARQ